MKIELEQEDVQVIASEIVDEIRRVLDNENTQHDDNLFDVGSLAEYLQVSRQWIYERVHFKEIPYIKIGKFLRFKRSKIDRWLDEFLVPAAELPLKLPKPREAR